MRASFIHFNKNQDTEISLLYIILAAVPELMGGKINSLKQSKDLIENLNSPKQHIY